jgi:hypothetical protein
MASRLIERSWLIGDYGNATGVLHDLDGALTDERSRHRMGVHAVAGDAPGDVGGAQEDGLRRLGGCPLRHRFSERTQPLEQRGFRVSDQDVGCVAELLALFQEVLRRLAYLLHPPSYFGRKLDTAVQVGAGALGQVATTARA